MYETCEAYYVDDYKNTCKKISNRVGGYYNAEDVVMEAFTRAMRSIGNFNPDKGDFSNWFISILNNSRKDFVKEERMLGMSVNHIEFDEELHDPIPMDDGDYQLVKMIKEEIENLPPETKNICHAFFVCEMTPREIHQLLGVDIRRVNNVTSRFKQQMREKYGD